MNWWRGHWAEIAHWRRVIAPAMCITALVVCAGCPAPYPPVPHQELAERILQPPSPNYQQPPGPTDLPAEVTKPHWPDQSVTSARGVTANRARVAASGPVANGSMSGGQMLIGSRNNATGSNVRQASYVQAENLPEPSHGPEDAPVPPKSLEPRAQAERRIPETLRADATEGVIDCNTLTLAGAIDLAYRNNPEIQKAHARLNLAHAGKDIAYADFLPGLDGGYRFIGGTTRPNGFVMPTVASEIGNVAFNEPAQAVGMAELRAQWTVWDFGRIMSKYGQSLVAEQIAGLQYTRTQQTVAYQVTKAYFDALDANATMEVAEEAVRRAQSALNDAKNYLHRGNAIRNDVMRANVFLKDMQLELVKARTAQGVTLAKLNETMGLNSAEPPRLVELGEPPRFEKNLGDCLQYAVDNRPEFGVVEQGIANAKLGQNVAEADFLPKVVVGAIGAVSESHDKGDAQHGSAGVAIEIGLYQGGRRIAELRGSHAEIDLAVASGKQVCDQIAYEVKVAFLTIDDAKERIEVARVATAQANENLRVIKSQFEQGDAIPTDIIEAQLALTRAQQGYLIATYDYETALATLAYALGMPTDSFLAVQLRR